MFAWHDRLCVNFNPRSHERSDLPRSVGYADGNNFNPRSHERSDATNPQNAVHSS